MRQGIRRSHHDLQIPRVAKITLDQCNRIDSAQISSKDRRRAPGLGGIVVIARVVRQSTCGTGYDNLVVPLSAEPALDERRARAERIINLEKPGHTGFEVKFYWAAFRLGEARLGTDTIVDRGSRMLYLTRPLILDETYLAEGYLASRNPPDLADRQITGRTRLGQ